MQHTSFKSSALKHPATLASLNPNSLNLVEELQLSSFSHRAQSENWLQEVSQSDNVLVCFSLGDHYPELFAIQYLTTVLYSFLIVYVVRLTQGFPDFTTERSRRFGALNNANQVCFGQRRRRGSWLVKIAGESNFRKYNQLF